MTGFLKKVCAGLVGAALLVATVVVAGPVIANSTPPAPWVPGQLLVGLTQGADKDDVVDTIAGLGGQTVNTASLGHFHRVCGQAVGSGGILAAQFSSDAAADAARGNITATAGVAFVQRAHAIVPAASLNPGDVNPGDPTSDPDFDLQWPLRNTGQHLSTPFSETTAVAGWDIDADEAWSAGATGQGEIIAVLDDGLSVNHPDLAPNIWKNTPEVAGLPGVDDDGNGWVDDTNGWSVGPENGAIRSGRHGTWVAGIAAARGGNGIGGSGVAPKAKIMPVIFIQGEDVNTLSELNALGAFAYAIGNDATVINNSWGFVAPVGIGSPVMNLAVRCAAAHDIPIAWSAGNLFAAPQSHPAYYPSDNVVLTTVFDEKGCPGIAHPQHPVFADVSAPGSWVHTTSSETEYTFFGQSSAAAPHVAGVMALVRQMRPTLTAQQVVLAIRNGSEAPFPEPWTKSMGFLNAKGALIAPVDGLHPNLASAPDPSQFSITRCYVDTVVELADRLTP